jgi:hypothetical protein
MSTYKKIWLAALVVFVVTNAGGAVYAAALGEAMHALAHAGLLVLGLGAYGVWRVASRSRQRAPAGAPDTTGQLEYLQQSVDAMALEVERIGEAQRFTDKLRDGRVETQSVKNAPEQK